MRHAIIIFINEDLDRCEYTVIECEKDTYATLLCQVTADIVRHAPMLDFSEILEYTDRDINTFHRQLDKFAADGNYIRLKY